MSRYDNEKMDAVEMQRSIREKIGRDIEGMSLEEEKRYYAERIRRWRPGWRAPRTSGEERTARGG